jgi:hypothetical protein
MQIKTLQQFVHWPRLAKRAALTVAMAACLGATACGGSSQPPRRPPTARDVATIAGAVSNIVYECQSAQAGLTAGADPAAIAGDVAALVRVYPRVVPDARLTIGRLHTTPRRELRLAQANLAGGDCSAAAARRLASALDR